MPRAFLGVFLLHAFAADGDVAREALVVVGVAGEDRIGCDAGGIEGFIQIFEHLPAAGVAASAAELRSMFAERTSSKVIRLPRGTAHARAVSLRSRLNGSRPTGRSRD
jgi:hypothetical protein